MTPKPFKPATDEDYFEDEGALESALTLDDDEVIGLDDAAARLDDPADFLSGEPEHEGGVPHRWHDVGPADDAVDPAASLVPDADESGYTREGDAVGFEGELTLDEDLAGFGGRFTSSDDAGFGDELLGDLELPELPALDADSSEGAELGPDEDVDAFADALAAGRWPSRGEDEG